MAGSLNALGLIGVVALTLVALFIRIPKWHNSRQLTIRVLIVFPVAFFAMMVSTHLCRSGEALTQWLIPAVCIILVRSFTRINWLQHAAVSALVVAALGLSYHFVHIVHLKEYTGNPASGEGVRRVYLHVLREDLVESGLDTQQHFPSGWLRDIVDEELEIYAGFEHLSSLGIVSHVWHTSLTRIYRVTDVPADVWYPGGVLADSLEQIELRARPES